MKYLRLTFSLLWVLGWCTAAVALFFSGAPWYVGVGCLAISPWLFVYDLVLWDKK